jgi:hypothetical protein
MRNGWLLRPRVISLPSLTSLCVRDKHIIKRTDTVGLIDCLLNLVLHRNRTLCHSAWVHLFVARSLLSCKTCLSIRPRQMHLFGLVAAWFCDFRLAFEPTNC